MVAPDDRIELAVWPFADRGQDVPGRSSCNLHVEHVLVVVLTSLLIKTRLHLVFLDLELARLLLDFHLVLLRHFLSVHAQRVARQDVHARGILCIYLRMLVCVVTRKPRRQLVG